MIINQKEAENIKEELREIDLETYKMDLESGAVTSLTVRVPVTEPEKINLLAQKGWKYSGHHKQRIPEPVEGIQGWLPPKNYEDYQCMVYRF